MWGRSAGTGGCARVIGASLFTMLSGCVSGGSSSNIEESTYGRCGSVSPSAHTVQVSKVVGTQRAEAFEREAKANAEKLCPSGFVLQSAKYLDEYYTYDRNNQRVPLTVLEWHIQCAAEPRGQVRGSGTQIVESLASAYSGDGPLFDAHAAVLSTSLEAAIQAAVGILKGRGDQVWEVDERNGTIITAPTKFGAIGLYRYDQFFIAFERLPGGQTRMTFKLFSYWQDYAAAGSALLKPHTREAVYSRAAAFIDAAKTSVTRR